MLAVLLFVIGVILGRLYTLDLKLIKNDPEGLKHRPSVITANG